MKKIVYLLAILGIAFTGCEPLEDINAEVDTLNTIANVISGDAVYTLEDDDYVDLDLSYGNFNSTDDAKSMIPELLSSKYPVWGLGSSVLITYKKYSKVATYSEIVYELSADEHNVITGDTYGNFSSGGDIYDYIEANYPSPSDGDFISLRYDYYSGGVSTLTDGFAYENGEWSKIKGFTENEYKDMGESYPNFSSHDEAAAKMPIKLLDVYKYDPKSNGDVVRAMYELYKGKDDNGKDIIKSYTSNFVFDGAAFVKYDNEAIETIQFGHDGTVWVPDNTIKYTLVQADYDLVGNGNYANFDVRAGKDEETDEVRLGKINTILLNNFPGNAEGQKYIVTYDVYSGSNEIWTMNVILEGGAYVLN